MTSLSNADLDKKTVTKAYDRWAPVYDLVFGAVFERGRDAAIAAAERVGGRILEVGVGTGIALPQYPKNCTLCGIDISEQMLRKAHDRVAEFGLTNVEGLWVMDAEHLSFPDGSFDAVVAQYVVTTAPNPEATLDEFARVLKPGGEIILVSRVGAEAGLRRAVEHALRRRCASSAGVPSFPSSAMRIGRRVPKASASSNAGPCRRSGISRLFASPRTTGLRSSAELRAGHLSGRTRRILSPSL